MRNKKQKVNDQINSFIGKEVKFDGKLTFTGSVKIDGHFKGEITASAGALIVGDTGVVEADIQVSSVHCRGEIRGRITAAESVNVEVPGKVFGDVQTPTIIIQEGVRFEGSCKTTPPEPVTGRTAKEEVRSVQLVQPSKQSAQKDGSAG